MKHCLRCLASDSSDPPLDISLNDAPKLAVVPRLGFDRGVRFGVRCVNVIRGGLYRTEARLTVSRQILFLSDKDVLMALNVLLMGSLLILESQICKKFSLESQSQERMRLV